MTNDNEAGHLRAFVINPGTRTVHPVRWDGALKTICRHLDCLAVDLVRIDANHDKGTPPKAYLYIDESGPLFDDQAFFVFKGAESGHPLAGTALLVGPGTDDGDDSDAPFELSNVLDRVQWVDAQGGNAVAGASALNREDAS
jgi:hypothetical protein